MKKLAARVELSANSGFVVLTLLVILTLFLLGTRLTRNTVNTEDAIPIDRNIPTSSSNKISGIARVVDGDTIEIAGQKIRIFGIDAPERGQVCRDESNRNYGCGIKASALVDDLIAGQVVTCLQRSRDRYDRSVAVCTVRGQDLGREIVAAGWAVAFERYSSDYADAEKAARKEHLGLWQGGFELPSSVRAQKGAPH